MIGFLRGVVLEKSIDSVLVDVSGVGYEVIVPASTLCALPTENEIATMYIYTYVREDSIRLYGFSSLFDKKVFECLLDVSGIGPKAAVLLLGSYDGKELCDIILDNRIMLLTSIPGIGSKTAERIILELKTKCQKLLARFYEPRKQPIQKVVETTNKQEFLFDQKPVDASALRKQKYEYLLDDLKSALINLGYKDKQFYSIVNSIKKRMDDGEHITLESGLKEALKKLSSHVLKNDTQVNV